LNKDLLAAIHYIAGIVQTHPSLNRAATMDIGIAPALLNLIHLQMLFFNCRVFRYLNGHWNKAALVAHCEVLMSHVV